MRLGLTCAVLVAACACANPAVAADNAPPLVDAGVDQSVSLGTTVYLDANGSTDPDGTIASVSWTIERPDGSTQTPACQSCRTTEFEADTTGKHVVTLEVTDNDGATRSDTLYVTVQSDGGPTVSLSGSDRVDRDTETSITAEIESDGPSLDMIAWTTGGELIEKQSLAGTTDEPELTHSFDDTGEKRIKAVVYDTLGNRATETHTTTVTKPLTDQSVSRGDGGGGGGGSPCPDTMPLYNDGQFVGCRTGADSVYQKDGEKVFVDTNDEPGIQMYDGEKQTTYTKENENLRERKDGTLVLENEQGQSTVEALEQGQSEKDSTGSSKLSGASAGRNSGQESKDDKNDNNGDNGGSDYDSGGSGSDNDNQNNSDDDGSNSNNNGDDNGGDSNSGGGGFLGGLFGGGNDGGGGGLFGGGGDDDSGGSSDNDSGGGLFGGLF